MAHSLPSPTGWGEADSALSLLGWGPRPRRRVGDCLVPLSREVDRQVTEGCFQALRLAWACCKLPG